MARHLRIIALSSHKTHTQTDLDKTFGILMRTYMYVCTKITASWYKCVTNIITTSKQPWGIPYEITQTHTRTHMFSWACKQQSKTLAFATQAYEQHIKHNIRTFILYILLYIHMYICATGCGSVARRLVSKVVSMSMSGQLSPVAAKTLHAVPLLACLTSFPCLN